MYRQVKRKAPWSGGPAAKKRRRTFRRRRPNRRFRRGGKNIRTAVLRQPVADRTLTKLKYCQKLVMATPVGSYSIERFQSSIYKPYVNGTGHQPLYHDQWALLYQKYKVHGIKYRLQFINMGSYAAWVSIQHQQTGSYTPSSIEYEMERPNNRGKFLLPSYQGLNRRIIKGYLPVAKTEGLSKSEFQGHEDYEASFGANPAKVARLAIEYEAITATTEIDCLVELIFFVEMWTRVDVGGS